MKIIILQILDSTRNHIGSVVHGMPYQENFWFWIALAESFAIVYLFLISLKYKRKKQVDFDEQLIVDSKRSAVDMGNVLNSIYQSKALYDKLKIKCHPDRFTDKETNIIADQLFQEITKNKRNYNKLLDLKQLAEQKLNLKI